MNNDLIKRNLAIAYATSGLVRRIDGEDWIRIAEVKQSLNDAPSEPQVTVCAENASKEEIEDFKQALEHVLERPYGEWINVNDHLPDDMQKVLIWFEYFRYGDFNCMYQTYGFGYVCDGKWSPFINGETGWQDYRIIAWQPLPKPYKKGGAE